MLMSGLLSLGFLLDAAIALCLLLSTCPTQLMHRHHLKVQQNIHHRRSRDAFSSDQLQKSGPNNIAEPHSPKPPRPGRKKAGSLPCHTSMIGRKPTVDGNKQGTDTTRILVLHGSQNLAKPTDWSSVGSDGMQVAVAQGMQKA